MYFFDPGHQVLPSLVVTSLNAAFGLLGLNTLKYVKTNPAKQAKMPNNVTQKSNKFFTFSSSL